MDQAPPKAALMVGGSVLPPAGLHQLWERRKRVDLPAGPASMKQQGRAWIGLLLAIAGVAALAAGLRW